MANSFSNRLNPSSDQEDDESDKSSFTLLSTESSAVDDQRIMFDKDDDRILSILSSRLNNSDWQAGGANSDRDFLWHRLKSNFSDEDWASFIQMQNELGIRFKRLKMSGNPDRLDDSLKSVIKSVDGIERTSSRIRQGLQLKELSFEKSKITRENQLTDLTAEHKLAISEFSKNGSLSSHSKPSSVKE